MLNFKILAQLFAYRSGAVGNRHIHAKILSQISSYYNLFNNSLGPQTAII